MSRTPLSVPVTPDWEAFLRCLRREGTPQRVHFIELFLDEVETTVMRLKTAPDPANFEADLHFLKGGAWNLGFADFGALCQDGEKRAAKGAPGSVDVGAIVDCYFASKTDFMSGLAGRAGSSAA